MNEQESLIPQDPDGERNAKPTDLVLIDLRKRIMQDDPTAINTLLNMAADNDIDVKTEGGLPRLPYDIIDDIQQKIDSTS